MQHSHQRAAVFHLTLRRAEQVGAQTLAALLELIAGKTRKLLRTEVPV